MHQITQEQFERELAAGRINPAEYLIAVHLDAIFAELKQLNGLLLRLLDGPKPPEKIALAIKKGQAKK